MRECIVFISCALFDPFHTSAHEHNIADIIEEIVKDPESTPDIFRSEPREQPCLAGGHRDEIP